MNYPSNFLARPVDRSLLMKLKSLAAADSCSSASKQKFAYFLYRVWADFGQGIVASGIARRYTGWSDGDYDIYCSHGEVKPCDLFLVVEDFVEWDGVSCGLIGEALDAGFLEIKRDDVKGVYLECVGFSELNMPKKLLQARGGMMKGLNNGRRKGLEKFNEFEDFVVATDAGKEMGVLDHGLSADAAKEARSLIFQINKVLGNDKDLGVGDMTPELVMQGDELMRGCGGDDGVSKLLEWVYMNKEGVVGKDRMDIVLKMLLGKEGGFDV